MEKLTRRDLIKQTSVSAGLVGVLATTAACTSSGNAHASGTDVDHTNIPDEPLAVFVTDPTRGTLVIMRGKSEITVNNPSLAQSLLSLQ